MGKSAGKICLLGVCGAVGMVLFLPTSSEAALWHSGYNAALQSMYAAQSQYTIVDITTPADGVKFTYSDAAQDPSFSYSAAATVTLVPPGPVYPLYMQWGSTPIQGSQLTSVPPLPVGVFNVSFTYTGLPAYNSAFGFKSLAAQYLWIPPGADYCPFGVYFPEEATNHPGPGTGWLPNWFFYWMQTSAGYGYPDYDENNTYSDYGYTIWDSSAGAYVHFLCTEANESYTPPDGPEGVKDETHDGIDSFAWLCRHEARHVVERNEWWPNGTIPPAADVDGDRIPDALEAGLNNPEGYQFDPAERDTDGDGWRDAEDYTMWTQEEWDIGSADSEDWANPGHQY